jgi:DNA-directed RNA polymerase subunit omega
MAHVPIEDIMEHVDSKYRLVIVAAKRAKQLNRGAVPLVQARNVKSTYQALEEVATGKLGYEVESLAGEAARELEPGAKPTWYRSLSAE